MDEELNEEEIEERLYAMIHHVDMSQLYAEQNVAASSANTAVKPQTTLRRYWRTSGDLAPINNPYQKINQPNRGSNTPVKTATAHKNTAPPQLLSTAKATGQTVNPTKLSCPQETAKTPINSTDSEITKPKKERTSPSRKAAVIPNLAAILLDKAKTTIQILENDDDVIEVALPPKPTITIESSDEDELVLISPKKSPEKNVACTGKQKQKKSKKRQANREVSASPVPSVVSSVSDYFIRGDCIALNISSQNTNKQGFDFHLHGSDLLGTPTRKKKKKKNKEKDTPIPVSPEKSIPNDTTFATPRNKSKSKKQKNKQYAVTQQSLPNPDIYDSDSNQSFDYNRKEDCYNVTDKSLPSADVYESDSSQSEVIKSINPASKEKNINDVNTSDCSSSLLDNNKQTKQVISPTNAAIAKSTPRKPNDKVDTSSYSATVDLTDDVQDHDDAIIIEDTSISENIIMANVTGFKESDDYEESSTPVITTDNNPQRFGSTKVPAILTDDDDIDFLKGSGQVKHQFSPSSVKSDMDKFYNESWGGENFNHRELLRNMSRDKSLWEIDAKDRYPSSPYRQKTKCNYCKRIGHRDDTCHQKPSMCHMCGNTGHQETRCPNKICVNCGSPNYIYSAVCRHCVGWRRVVCHECRQPGHPASHCPDLWRRYHNTIDSTPTLVENRRVKPYHEQYCSSCCRRGHLAHVCQVAIPFSGMPINSPYVANYNNIYPLQDRCHGNENQGDRSTNQRTNSESHAMTNKMSERNKRQSKSPSAHEHSNKKKNTGTGDVDVLQGMSGHERKTSLSEPAREVTKSRSRAVSDRDSESEKGKSKVTTNDATNPAIIVEKAQEFIPISSSNHNYKGHIIQDNKVSDTNDVVTVARIYVTAEIIERLKTDEGQSWLIESMKKHHVSVSDSDVKMFLSIKGKLADQETFQTELREWIQKKQNKERQISENQSETEMEVVPYVKNGGSEQNIPKIRNNLLRMLTKAFKSLSDDLGDPSKLFTELSYLQNLHSNQLKQKVICPKQLDNSSGNISKIIKKLNIVLLGQAGLAGGAHHLSQLRQMQRKITFCRSKYISLADRQSIGQHYHCIFNATPRDDYQDLLQTFYKINNHVKSGNNNRRNKKARPPMQTPVANKHNNRSSDADIPRMPKLPQSYNNAKPSRQINAALDSLRGVQNSILQFKTRNAIQKKEKIVLNSKLTSLISNLNLKIKTNTNARPNIFKKVKQIRTTALIFLNNNSKHIIAEINK